MDILLYQPAENSVPELSNFTLMMLTEVSAMFMGIKLKCCHLDPIPTTMLKVMLLTCTPVLTNIRNKSVGEGAFCILELKSTRVKPLIKVQGADVEKSNYCPVSNLPFLSKKKSQLKQLTTTVTSTKFYQTLNQHTGRITAWKPHY